MLINQVTFFFPIRNVFLTSFYHSTKPCFHTSYLEPASGTLRSTRHSHSSQTPPLGSGGDTCPHPPGHEGRRGESGSRSGIDLQPGRRVISPEIQPPWNTWRCLFRVKLCNASECTEHTVPTHPRRAHVNALVHGHVLDDGAVRKSQCHVVRPVETPFENGAAVYNRQRKNKHHTHSSFGVTEHSLKQLGLYPLTPEEQSPLRPPLPRQSIEALTFPLQSHSHPCGMLMTFNPCFSLSCDGSAIYVGAADGGFSYLCCTRPQHVAHGGHVIIYYYVWSLNVNNSKRHSRVAELSSLHTCIYNTV